MEAIFTAILTGHASCHEIEVLLNTSPSEAVEHRHNGFTPLCLACKLNRYDLVALFLCKGANPNTPSYYYGKHPLHFACDHSGGNIDTVRLLVSEGAQVNVRDEDGNTGLHLACTESNVAVVQFLIASGADVTAGDLDNETPLVRACYAKSVELIDILLKAGSDANHPNGLPLEIAVRSPSLEGLKLLIAGGAEVTRNAYLSFASEHNYLDMMKILHNYGVDVNRRGQLNLTALHHACISHQSTPDAIRLLLSWGANINAASMTGDTPLHYACQGLALGKVRVLLANGAGINTLDATQLSPLLVVLTTKCQPTETSEYVTLVKLLLAAGARIRVDTLERLKVLIVYLQSSAEDQEGLYQLLMHHASRPLPLQHLCRNSVRAQIGTGIDERVCCLPLPLSMIAFLQFDDVLTEESVVSRV